MEKKPIYKRKWFIAIIVLVVLSFAFSGGESSSSKKESTSKENKTEEVKEYKIGELLKVGDMEYRVLDMSVTNKVGNKYLNKKSQGLFLLLTVEITNRSDEPVSVSDEFFKLKNGEKTFSTSDDVIGYLGDNSIIYKEVNPDTTLKGQICFDLNENIARSKDNVLEVQTGVWGTEKGRIALKKA